MRKKNSWRGVLALALGLGPAVALAQWPAFELERLELNPGAEGSLVVGMGELLPAGKWRTSAVAHYSHRPLVVARGSGPTAESVALVGSRVTTHLAGAYALLDWLQVGVQLPVVTLQQGQSGLGFTRPEGTFGLGTPVAHLRLGVLRQTEAGGVDLAVEGGVGLPVGSAEVLSRDEGMRYAPKLMVGRRFGVVRAAVEAGVLLRPGARLNTQRLDATEGIGDELRLGATVATTGRRLRWEFNLRGMVSLANQPGSAEFLPGARYLVDPSLEVFGLVGVGIGAAPGTPTFRVLVGGAFGDVIPRRGPGESAVNCDPGLPHTIEECPDRDEDGDGVQNVVDMCPDVAGLLERKGCPPKDTDSDGIDDMLDGCPLEAGPGALQGCPVPDKDKDEVSDDQDSCPEEPGPPDNRGCPVKDTDKDGIENDQDACPNEPGPPERQGCPEEDTDKDGVPNRVDSCISVPGAEDNAGCPVQEAPLVTITPKQLELKGKVYFEASQPRVQSRSYELLEWVARVVKEHPEIPLVLVAAHTDDRGFPEELRRLSQQRAEAVRRFLIEKGAPAEKLEVKGFGPDRPIDSNATSIGRENNRRVEFLIVRDRDESSQEPRR